MRQITTHQAQAPGINNSLILRVLDEPGRGNACRKYQVELDLDNGTSVIIGNIDFQDGLIAEAGINGLTNEILLAIVQDRLEGFQSGDYACEANNQALEGIISAMSALHSRTLEQAEKRKPTET